MKLFPSRSKPSLMMCALVAGVALVGVALAQPPAPGGGPGGPGKGGPGGGPGGGGPGPGGGGGPGDGGGGPGGPGGTAPTPNFALFICNKASQHPVVFVSTVSVVGQQFRAQGWSQVQLGQCAQVGIYQRPAVWFHARSPQGTHWVEKPEVDVCVNLNGGFDYSWPGDNRPCQGGETGVPFEKIEVGAQYNRFTLTLN